MSQAFDDLEAVLRKEFSCGPIIRMSDAKAGHEEELTKLLVVLAYLATIRHYDSKVASALQESTILDDDLQLRWKRIFQVGRIFCLIR